MDKKVSVIIPCYNQEKYIKEAINSVLNQTYKNIEIIIINDCSKDNSHEIIQEIINKHSDIIYINSETNQGVIKSRNIAIQKASGEYILPLDGDDKIDKTYIEKAVKILENNETIGMVYCDAEFFGDKTGKWDLPEYDDLKILYYNMVFCTALFRKSDWEKVGGYKEYMQNGCEDWDFWLSFIELGLKPYKIPETLFYYRQFNKETSRNTSASNRFKEIQKTVFEHHKDMYLNNEEFMNNTFEALHIKEQADKKKRKYKKYILILSVIIFILIIINVLTLLGVK